MSTQRISLSLLDVQMENDRLKQQIDAGAMAQPVEEESVKGLTAQGINLSRSPKILQNNFILTYNHGFKLNASATTCVLITISVVV